MHRRALLVGIDFYDKVDPLAACVADVEAMAQLLQQHEDGSPNYGCHLMLARTIDCTRVTRAELRLACAKLFDNYTGDVLFYFSGHGALTQAGGYLATSDACQGDVGVPMDEVLGIANQSKARDILIILDCCFSGALGNPAALNPPGANPLALLRENLTVIAATRPSEVALEADGHGSFTSAVLDGLRGGAADPLGYVTAPAVYSYAQWRFGAWDQRPIYKSHATDVTVVRECAPIIDRLKLRQLADLFPSSDYKFPLDPEYEPEDEYGNMHTPVNEDKLRVARVLKDYRNAGIIRPTLPNEQLFWTARYGHTVELTPIGRQYWWLVSNKKI